MLSTISRLSQRMESLIESLRVYSRVGRADLAVADTDLDDVLDEVLESLEIWLGEHHAEVVRPRPLPVVRCDRARVGEVFRNLITNAVKYDDSPVRRVEVGAELHGPDGAEVAQFYVADNGIGIAAKHRESIFGMLKRLHGRDKYGGGTGAGLSITRKIVERHGGRIWVESEPGRGAVFRFTLQSDASAEA